MMPSTRSDVEGFVLARAPLISTSKSVFSLSPNQFTMKPKMVNTDKKMYRMSRVVVSLVGSNSYS